jgi:hypothetical protein
MRCPSCAPSPAPPNGEYLPKPVDPLLRVDEDIFDRSILFLIQSTHHQLPRHQAASPHSLRFIHEVHHTQYVHMGYWQTVG